MKRLFLPAILAAALVIAGCSQNRANPRDENGENQSTAGQDNVGAQDASPNAFNAQDKDFAQRAAMGGEAEVHLGQLALQRASSPKVREFAQTMVNDHEQAGQQLQKIAGKKDLDLPNMVPTEAQDEQNKLSRLSGAQFDKEYMRFMVEDHRKDAQEFERARNEVSDPDLKHFAVQTLPTIQKHLRTAQQLAGKQK